MFLAGDAVHLVIPTGGLGMNTGVGDAIDLSWKLAATLQGWGGPNLLASYETERRQVGARNVAASRFASRGRRTWRAMWRPNIRDNTPEGAATRAELVARRRHRAAQGEQDDRRRARLPLRRLADHLAGGGEGPAHDFIEYTPTTWPGARLPHVWLDDGTAMQDRIGNDRGFTLLRLGESAGGRLGAWSGVCGDRRAARTCSTSPTARRARSTATTCPAAAGHACRLARQPPAGRCRLSWRHRHGGIEGGVALDVVSLS